MTQTNYSYATTYDRQLQQKPLFLRLRQQVSQQAYKWNIASGDIIAHLGEDTGYFSLNMAALHPQSCVVHISDDIEMNCLTEEKQLKRKLSNHRILEMGFDKLEVESNSLKAVVSIHLLSTFPNPCRIISKIESWLEEGGYFMFTTPPSSIMYNRQKVEFLSNQLNTLLACTNLEVVHRQSMGTLAGELFVLRKR